MTTDVFDAEAPGSTPPRTSAQSLYRLSVGQYRRMTDAGIFGDRRAELLGGLLFMMAQYPPHIRVSENLAELLKGRLDVEAWTVREGKTASLGRGWLPEPDVAVARGPQSISAERLPRARDFALLAEISDATYAKDRGLKWRAYASARIPRYWIVDLARRRVETFSAPTGRGASAFYRESIVYQVEDEIPLRLDDRDFGGFSVRSLLA